MTAVALAPTRLRVGKRRNQRDEHRLAKRLKRRDEEALREVYERFARVTFGFLLGVLRDPATAEDVQQQVFLQVWERADSYDPRRGSLLTWIMLIARSRALDELRRRVPEPRDTGGAIALLESSQRTDENGLDELIEHWHMADMLGRLPAAEAELLRRRFQGGQSQSEIAADTGIPLGTVKARMRSGLEGLRRMLEDEAA
jgi:RNA polymerase sigma-70 factor, ECF subfamily